MQMSISTNFDCKLLSHSMNPKGSSSRHDCKAELSFVFINCLRLVPCCSLNVYTGCTYIKAGNRGVSWNELFVLTCPVDPNFPIEAEFVSSDFLLIPLAPRMNQKIIMHIFSISS